MNRNVFLITALLFLIVSIGAVSAENINQTDDCLEIDGSDVLSVGQPKSFADLSKDIDDSPQDRIDIVSDYKFNDQSDKGMARAKDLTISAGGKYTINGNNHVIDADNKAGVFKFSGGTVVINNLKIINAKSSSIILYDCELQTNNVTFENNNDPGEGAAIYAEQANYYSSHDKFINNYANNGASIYSVRSIVDIDNSTFISNKAVHWSLIYGYNSIMTVSNSIFTNMSSKYATAIYSEKNKLTVSNSKFINLFANATAGAIGCKGSESVTINGCSFINVTSSKNAGAIYADINANNISYKYSVTITDSLFENCSSNFGGAYIQLGGELNLVNSNFENNIAKYSGGAIYLSNTTALIGNSRFGKNIAELNGGAAYIDDSNVIINSCDFISNNATNLGCGIYLYDSKYEIKNSFFNRNDDEVIVSFFDRLGSSMKNNEMNGEKTLLNQSYSNTVVEYEGKKIILNPTVVNETAKSPKFDLRDYTVNGHSLAGVVKDQGNNGACWVFGATGALESAFLKATGILLDISENNIQGAASYYSDIGDKRIKEGGYPYSGMAIFLAWLGVISSEFDSYDELGKISLAAFVPFDSYHIQDAVMIPPRTSALDNSKLKEALVNYGGVTVHLYGASANNDYYNPDTHAQYYNGKDDGNHFVTLVGWDDNYSRDNFKIKPAGDGAWICKNSWGTDWGENGYFYVSYYDVTFAMQNPSIAYIIKNTENYTRVYQYDMGFNGFFNDNDTIIDFVNTYDALDNELITAVGTYFDNAGDEYTIKISVDGNEVYSQSGTASHRGFETIKLDKKVAVNEGHKFSVMIQSKNLPLLETSRIHFEPGTSMAYFTDGSVDNLGKYNKAACIKAYTVLNPNPEKSKYQSYDKNSKTTVYSNANGKTIDILKNGKTLGSAIVIGGKASFDMTLDPGNYSIITYYDDGEVAEGFEVRNTIEVAESIKIGYNTKLTIDSKFYDGDGIELFNRNITVKVDDKNYSGIIENNEGMLYITLSSLSIGTHTLVLTNPATLEESVTTIKVISRFSGNSNVNMYYGVTSSFKVRVYGNDGNPVGANEIVTMKLNKVTYKVKTNSNGYAILSIPNTVKPGSYTLTATYAGQSIKNTVKVKQVLKLAKVNVKKSAKKLVITASLKKGNTPIKNTKLTFKFNGKTYTAKTNNKGIAKITVNKSVLKKLKVGKTIKYQATYLKDTVTQSVKVKK